MDLGCHMSIAKGFEAATRDSISIGANTFQFFTRNPRGGNAKAVDLKDYEIASRLMAEHEFGPLLAHAPYTMNLAAADPKVFEFAKQAFAEDLNRLEQMPCHLYNFHPGSHVAQGDEMGMTKIVSVINETLTGKESTLLLFETMAGKGSEVGYTFEQIGKMIQNVQHKEKMGVCLDTCHLYSAGYDLVNQLESVLESFDKIIGLDRLKAIHLNDSMTPFNSRKDRHEKIGKGSLGLDAIVNFINHPAIRHLPILLETPNENEGYAEEIKLLRGFRVNG